MLLIPSCTSHILWMHLHAQAWLLAAENPSMQQHTLHVICVCIREVQRCDAVRLAERDTAAATVAILGRPRFVPQEQERCSIDLDRFDGGRAFFQNPSSRANVGVGGGSELMA